MYQKILVPIDGSAPSTRGLDEAIGVAKLTKGTLRLLHVLDDLVFATGFEAGITYTNDILPSLQRAAERIVADGCARVAAAGVTADSLVAECFGRRASDVIVEQAKTWNADLIVIGSHGRRGVSRALLGSDAEQVARAAPVPVLLVRAAPETPVRT
jgi:nucleotide-binding universal stress UspA family protein